jgi:hypothetical protein
VTAVEKGQLAHERVEAAVGREQVAKSHGEQCGCSARPDEQGKVSQIAPADDSLSDLIGNVHCLFLRKDCDALMSDAVLKGRLDDRLPRRNLLSLKNQTLGQSVLRIDSAKGAIAALRDWP